jgi:hypothetical protein
MYKLIKYFHPKGMSLPNGSYYKKGVFINECSENKDKFVFHTSTNEEAPKIPQYRGGMLVFMASAVQNPNNEIKGAVRRFINAKQKHFPNDIIVIYPWNKSFKGKFIGNNGEVFNNKSICLEISGLSCHGLLELADMLTERFGQKAVLVKDLNQDEIYLVTPNETDDAETDEEDANPFEWLMPFLLS